MNFYDRNSNLSKTQALSQALAASKTANPTITPYQPTNVAMSSSSSGLGGVADGVNALATGLMKSGVFDKKNDGAIAQGVRDYVNDAQPSGSMVYDNITGVQPQFDGLGLNGLIPNNYYSNGIYTPNNNNIMQAFGGGLGIW